MPRHQWAIELGLMVAIGLVLALMGPFGTFAMPLAARLITWQIFILGGFGVFRPIVAAGSLVAEHGGMPRWLALGLACVLASMPVTVLVAWAMGGMAWRSVTLETLVGLYPNIVLVGIAITVVRVASGQVRVAHQEPLPETRDGARAPASARPRASQPETQPEPQPEPTPEPVSAGSALPVPRLLARLPAGLGGAFGEDLLALESEDHYIRVHARTGSTLVLLRLADAIAELEGVEGLRTHRSWWVARAAVAEVLRSDRTVRLRLGRGIEAPVARNAVPVLRGAGWL